jgi:hypothetical protein
LTTLRDWWDQLLGRNRPEPPRPRQSAKPSEPKPVGNLELAETPERAKSANRGRSGFDPYANDAGFGKPRGWDRGKRD